MRSKNIFVACLPIFLSSCAYTPSTRIINEKFCPIVIKEDKNYCHVSLLSVIANGYIYLNRDIFVSGYYHEEKGMDLSLLHFGDNFFTGTSHLENTLILEFGKDLKPDPESGIISVFGTLEISTENSNIIFLKVHNFEI